MKNGENKEDFWFSRSEEQSRVAGYHLKQMQESADLSVLLTNIIPYTYNRLLTTYYVMRWYAALDTSIERED